MIQWHTKNDVFRQGQWFHGRIFEHRCDLSPDGKFFAYCAYKPGNRLKNPDYGDSWTAVSRPPNFTAVALWPLGNRDGGGGYFMQDGRMWLNHLDDNRDLHPAYRLPKGLAVKTIETYEDESDYMFDDIHRSVMLRDGWNYASRPEVPISFHQNARMAPSPPVDTPLFTLGKTKSGTTLLCTIVKHHTLYFHPKRNKAELAKLRHWAKVYDWPLLHNMVQNPYHSKISHRYQYAFKIGESERDLPGVTWADFDRAKRLVLAKEGKLFAGKVENGELSLIELADFNYDKPAPPKRESK
jgi:hypothetical protein